MKNKTLSSLFVALTSIALLLVMVYGWGSAPVYAANFTVTRFDDPTPDGCTPTDCSLREAIIAVNGSLEPNTIVLPAGTYVLTLIGADDTAALGDLDIAGTVTLTGAGAEQTAIDASSLNDRIFDILSGAEVTLSGVSIVNGSVSGTHGGGIACNQAILNLENVTLSHNQAESGLDGGGLYAYECAVTLTGAQVHHNAARTGAGIQNYAGALTMTHSTVAHNAALEGGGGIMSTESAVNVSYSTLFSNTANSGGGGFFTGVGATLSIVNSLVVENATLAEAGGLAIQDNVARATVANTTISGNRTDGYGGGISVRVPTTITHATITGNVAGKTGSIDGGGGGLFAYANDAHVHLRHVVLAGNIALNDTTRSDCHRWGMASVTSLGYNLVEMVGNCAFDTTGDITAQAPLLGPLADNGGPTWTHTPLTGSPARDAGDPAFAPPPLYDQRGPGFNRAIGRIDIGAFETWQRIFLPLTLRNHTP